MSERFWFWLADKAEGMSVRFELLAKWLRPPKQVAEPDTMVVLKPRSVGPSTLALESVRYKRRRKKI